MNEKTSAQIAEEYNHVIKCAGQIKVGSWITEATRSFILQHIMLPQIPKEVWLEAFREYPFLCLKNPSAPLFVLEDDVPARLIELAHDALQSREALAWIQESKRTGKLQLWLIDWLVSAATATGASTEPFRHLLQTLKTSYRTVGWATEALIHSITVIMAILPEWQEWAGAFHDIQNGNVDVLTRTDAFRLLSWAAGDHAQA